MISWFEKYVLLETFKKQQIPDRSLNVMDSLFFAYSWNKIASKSQKQSTSLTFEFKQNCKQVQFDLLDYKLRNDISHSHRLLYR